MSRSNRLAALVLVAAAVTVTGTGPATGKPADTATLRCPMQSYTVDGFGRGQVLHVTSTNRNFIVTKAVRHSEVGDQVIFDSPAQADRQVVSCTTTTTTTTPGADGSDFTFTGFFTPAR